MFMVTAHMVKPVTPDDLPNMRGIDGLKGASPLGIEPKGEGVQGQSGYKVSGQTEQTPVAAPAAPAKVAEPKTKKVDATQTSTTGAVGMVRNANPALPVAKAVRMDLDPETVRPW
jgi:hypothetical protein